MVRIVLAWHRIGMAGGARVGVVLSVAVVPGLQRRGGAWVGKAGEAGDGAVRRVWARFGRHI
jgi:hypothetical protein